MTKIIFLEDARKDLSDIKDYFNETAPDSVDNILADIYVVLEVLSIWPLAGREHESEPGRRFVSPKYRFTVTYDQKEEQVEIMGIYRFQNRSDD